MCSFTKQSGTAELLRRVALIIWDEVGMTKRQAVETLDRTLQDITGCNQLFGGKVMLFGGDFRQVLPVVPRGTRAQITDATLRRSYIWNSLCRVRLTQNMHAKNDTWFADYLLRIGNGTEETFGDDYVQFLDDIVVEWSQNSSKTAKKTNPKDHAIDNLIEKVFPKLEANCNSADYMRERTILSTRNDHVDTVNAIMIKRYPGMRRYTTVLIQWMMIKGIIILLIC